MSRLTGFVFQTYCNFFFNICFFCCCFFFFFKFEVLYNVQYFFSNFNRRLLYLLSVSDSAENASFHLHVSSV